MEPCGGVLRLGPVRGAFAIAEGIEIPGDVVATSGVDAVHDETQGFAAFYTANHGSVARALALTLGDTELAAEATDEAMTRAYQRWATVRDYGNAAGWVYRVGLNWARSFLRKRRRTTSSPYLEDQPVDDPQPSDPSLTRALAGLDPKHRSVVVLRYFLDWSVDQTAEALQIAPGTVKSRLHRALNQLEAQLGAEEKS